MMSFVRSRTPISGPPRVRSVATRFTVGLLVVCAGCASKRDIPSDERGVPTTLPHEQVLYREARSTLESWVRGFGKRDRASLFPMLTTASKTLLRRTGIGNASSFQRWFSDRAQQNIPPFTFEFSRFDILDVDLHDTLHTVVTASFVVRVGGKDVESVGSFFLAREGGSWRIPFAESGDYERSWWQQEHGFGAKIRDEGLSHFSSPELGLDCEYPIAWDASEQSSMRAPDGFPPGPGMSLSYLNPGSMTEEACVRIWQKPLAGNESLLSDIDTAKAREFTVILKQDATLLDSFQYTGRTFWIFDKTNRRFLLVFGGVNPAFGSFETFAPTISSIIESFSIPH